MEGEKLQDHLFLVHDSFECVTNKLRHKTFYNIKIEENYDIALAYTIVVSMVFCLIIVMVLLIPMPLVTINSSLASICLSINIMSSQSWLF